MVTLSQGSFNVSISTAILSNNNLTVASYTPIIIDTFSTSNTLINAAYSVGRRLSNKYQGSAFKVRRSSDNTTLDIGFSGTAIDITNLLSFCSGTNGYVTTLYDQSGNGKHLTQSTSANQPQIVSAGSLLNPINSLPSMNLGYLQNTSWSWVGGTPTKIAVMTCSNFYGYNGTWTYGRQCSFMASGASHDYDGTTSVPLIVATGNYSNRLNTSRNTGSISIETTSLVANQAFITAAIYDGSNASLYFNNTLVGTAASTGVFGSTGSFALHWDNWNNGGELWNGATSELIVTNALATTDFTNHMTNMRTVYGTP